MNVDKLYMLAKDMREVSDEICKYPQTEEPPSDDILDAVDAIRHRAYDLLAAANRFMEG